MAHHLLQAPSLLDATGIMNFSSADLDQLFIQKLLLADLTEGISVLSRLLDLKLIKVSSSERMGSKHGDLKSILRDIKSSDPLFTSSLEMLIKDHPKKERFLKSCQDKSFFNPYSELGVVNYDGETVSRKIF